LQRDIFKFSEHRFFSLDHEEADNGFSAIPNCQEAISFVVSEVEYQREKHHRHLNSALVGDSSDNSSE